MKYSKKESFILNDMQKAFQKHRQFDYQLYYECKKCCYVYGTEQLYHAKAILEEEQIYGVENNNGTSIVLTFISIILTTITLWVSALTDKTKMECGYDYLIILGMIFVFLVTILFIMHNNSILQHRKSAYFYSIVCDEIERRNNGCQSK